MNCALTSHCLANHENLANWRWIERHCCSVPIGFFFTRFSPKFSPRNYMYMISLINIADSVPKNHYKENFKRILKIQAQSKEKQMELQKPVTVLRKSIKYDSVPPKVTVFAQVWHAFLHCLLYTVILGFVNFCSLPVHQQHHLFQMGPFQSHKPNKHYIINSHVMYMYMTMKNQRR